MRTCLVHSHWHIALLRKSVAGNGENVKQIAYNVYQRFSIQGATAIMEYEVTEGSIVRSFARRTLHNLSLFPESNASDAGRGQTQKEQVEKEQYEVTQLINSLLGLIVFPQEDFSKKLLDKKLVDVEAAKAFSIKVDTYEEKCDNLPRLIYHIRNSVSHMRLHFTSRSGEISKVEVRDKNVRKPSEEWCAEVDVTRLRAFVIWFAQGIVDGSLLKE